MPEINLPCKAWVLTPSYAPKEVELVERDTSYSGYFTSATGTHYFTTDLYTSKAEAIESGWRKLDDQMNALRKREAAIIKKKATLTKHSQDL
jgi:hypothetical protein